MSQPIAHYSDEGLFILVKEDALRLLDRQFRAAEENDDKAETAIKSGIIMIAFSLAIGTSYFKIIGDEFQQNMGFWIIISLLMGSLTITIVGIIMAGHSYISILKGPRALHEAPESREVFNNIKNKSYTEDIHLKKTVLGLLNAITENSKVMESTAKWRIRASLSFLAALLADATAVILIATLEFLHT